MPAAGQSNYTPEIGAKICELVEDCIGLDEIAAMGIKGIPSSGTTIRAWVRKHEDFGKMMDRAWLSRIQAEIEKTLEIADDGRNDWMERVVERDGKEKHLGWDANHEHIKRTQVRINQRNWLAERQLPKLYGNRIEVNATVNLSTESDEALLEKAHKMAEALGYRLVRIGTDG